ncbi:hypothetical protein PVAP13_2KG252758 [Panicum virgatum]|uniref:Ubiquitin-like protease family profile domain-containing protein n=1 Tax=Panicum virgatum TaxID=38727 RepID=A0A8T0W2J8_PANVG|nr:hypothetical protein PVAP13_2KG252758 [Panicum virgatum]
MMHPEDEMHCNVGFLDPQIFSAIVIQFQSKDVITAIKRAMNHDYVVGAYNTGFSLRKFKDVVTIVNWAYSEHMETKMKKNSKTKPKLTHKTYIKCAQQPSNSTSCGFYVALNMYHLLGDINVIRKASKLSFTCILNNCIMHDYKTSKEVDQGALRMVQWMLCDFILKEIIDPKGSFYDDPADAA